MAALENILEMMSRMRLFPETTNLRDKFFVEECQNDLLEEGVHKSYDAKDIYKILLRHYDIGPEESFINDGNTIGFDFDYCYNSDQLKRNNEIVVFALIVPNDFSDTEKIVKFMISCGWTLAQKRPYNLAENYTILSFEKNRQVKEVECPDFVYHLTPKSKINKILKNGLAPRTTNIMSNRPERIYLYPEKLAPVYFKLFANALYKANLEKKTNLSGLSKPEIGDKLGQPRTENYCLIQIDTAKCNNLKLYGDPDMDGAIWTYDNIPPRAIKIINDKI